MPSNPRKGLPTYSDFLVAHEPQLLASGVPEVFWVKLFEKLNKEIFDAGNFFQIVVERSEIDDALIGGSVLALCDLKANDPENIFLIDHAWTFRPNNLRAALTEIEGLAERLIAAFDIKDEIQKPSQICSSSRCTEIEPNDESDYCYSEVRKSQSETGIEEFSSNGSNETEGAPTISANRRECKDSNTMGTDDDGTSTKELNDRILDRILDEIWKYAQTYSIHVRNLEADEIHNQPIWYIPDEFGLRIGHSTTPNVKMVPFYYHFQNIAFSLLLPVADISENEEITRNYVLTYMLHKNPHWYKILMLPWQELDSSLVLLDRTIVRAPKDENYFMSSRIADLIPTLEQSEATGFAKRPPDLVNVCASDRQLIDRLSRVRINEVSDPLDADIIWKREHYHEFSEFALCNPGCLINQFPYESVLTVKDLFAATVQFVYGDRMNEQTLEWLPPWFPASFNLELELPEFVSYFKQRALKGLDNTWIIKPWNLARGLDIHVTRNLSACVRLAESGPKLACKYVHNPVLFERKDNGNWVKFDLRYIVFVRRLGNTPKDIDAYLYHRFWIRFAVNQFNLHRLDDVFTHLTVHNYSTTKNQDGTTNIGTNVYEMECEDFIKQFEALYPRISWESIHKNIASIIKEVLWTASSRPPPFGMAPNKQSRAMYGFDMMLKWKDSGDGRSSPARERSAESIQPIFLEANFMPDCERACQYYNDFADTVFETLFMEENPVLGVISL